MRMPLMFYVFITPRTDGILISIASDHVQHIPILLQYTNKYQGICYASVPLLKVDKLLAYTERVLKKLASVTAI